MYSINIKFEQKGVESVTLTNIGAGDSLLEILLDNKIELHHNCGGVCACSTCHLYVEGGDDYIDTLATPESANSRSPSGDPAARSLLPKKKGRRDASCGSR